MRIRSLHLFENIISNDNLLEAWKEFRKDKKNKRDVIEFEQNLIQNIQELRSELLTQTYTHGGYVHFRISDPKPRDIHKAPVRDRLLHHAMYMVLYPEYNKAFIADSYSCRKGKGTHKAFKRFSTYARSASKNNKRTVWVLKCDIRTFFASIDHDTLLTVLRKHTADEKAIWLLTNVICSFNSGTEGKGLPLGSLTSQLLVNIYMNEFDQYVKHTLKRKHYIRYADDFTFLSGDRNELIEIYRLIGIFLNQRLKLALHPTKCFIKTFASGVDFLGWVHFPYHRVLRTSTKRRMFRNISDTAPQETINSYRGMLLHGNAYKLSQQIDV